MNRDKAVEVGRYFRWNLLSWTSNSGNAMFVCSSCGRHSKTPDKNCPPRDGEDLHCEEYPTHPRHALALSGIERTLDQLVTRGAIARPGDADQYAAELERHVEFLQGVLRELSLAADEAAETEYAPEDEAT